MQHAAIGVLLLAALGGCEHQPRLAQWPTPGQSAIDRALRATVIVETGDGMCAGYWADANTVVTAAHCVDPGRISRVTTGSEQELPAEVTYFDPLQDVAILSPIVSVEYGHEWLVTARIDPYSGDPVYAIGHPARFTYSVSAGVVAHPRRHIEAFGLNGDYMQANMGIWFGNSGGPAIDVSGDVVGIASWFYATPSLCFFVHHEQIDRALRAEN